MRDTSLKVLKLRRSFVAGLVLTALLVVGLFPDFIKDTPQVAPTPKDVLSQSIGGGELASELLDKIEVKGRAPKTGYARSQFGDGWATVLGCDMRNIMLARGMVDVELATDNCVVLKGTLADPYTGKTINFVRGDKTSSLVQIDHVVALSDSWQKGAQNLEPEVRLRLANDPLNLLAVDGPANQAKGDGDAASWLPPNKAFRCQYVARQIAVKVKYSLWVTEGEKTAMVRVLNGCVGQVVPLLS